VSRKDMKTKLVEYLNFLTAAQKNGAGVT